VYGLFCGAFCDFGDSFNVVDPTGEEPKEVFIANITKVRDMCVISDQNI
jgi:ubiquitin-activating enzyme E1-like protein 2